MAEKKQTKIQPAVNADTLAGQPSPAEATEVSEVTAEKFAGMTDEQKMAYINNANNFIKSATQKSQEAASVKRQNEQLQAESKYWKSQAETMQGNLQKLYEAQVAQTQHTTQSTPSQPPEYDPYNPDKWARDTQKYYEERINHGNSKYEELKKTVDSLRDEFGVGLRTINVERYLEKAIPKLGKNVDADEIVMWFNMHPEVQANTETINQAITERQSKIDALAEQRAQEYLAEKEKAAQGAQDAEGSAPWAGGAPKPDEFVNMTPAEREKAVADFMERSLKARGGGD